MATTYTSALVASGLGFTGPGGGVVFMREATHAFTAALVINDVFQMIPVFPGERVVGAQLISPDLDSDGSPAVVLSLGDGDDDDRYIAASAIGQAGGMAVYGAGIDTAAEAASVDKRYTTTDTVDIKVKTAPAASATSGTFRVRAFIVRS